MVGREHVVGVVDGLDRAQAHQGRHLPARRAQRECGLEQAVGHQAQHVVGRLRGEDSAVLQDLLNAPTTWAEPSGEVALDMSDDVLTLRRAREKREWAETPGVTSTPIISKFRRALRDVTVEGARRTSRPVEIAL